MATFVRRDIYSLAVDDPIVVAYGDAIEAMRAKPATDPTSWTYQAAIHGTHTTPKPPLANECRHQSWWFPSWHRMYVYYFERIVRAQVIALGGPAKWALPYWDYDRDGTRALPEAFRSPTRPDGTPNPLFVAQRAPGINSGSPLDPAITTAVFALSRPHYAGVTEFGGGITSPVGQFRGATGRLEQTPHNDIHVAIGGSTGWMRDPDRAAQDPIFWLHHANIDRLWWEWNKSHKNPMDPAWTDQPFPFFDETGTQVSLRGFEIEDIDGQLDYTYQQKVVFPGLRVPVEVFRRRPPWPPWIKEIVRMPEIPQPEPRPPFPTGPGPEMIGATEEPLRLVGDLRRVRVAVDQRARRAVLGDNAPRRIVLDIQDIDAEASPGTVYAVYVNLPENASSEQTAEHHVGNVSLFGVERTRDPGNDDHPHGGMSVAVDITDLVAHLSEQGRWNDDELEVTFRPVGVQITQDSDDATEIRAAQMHGDRPVSIGRISLHVE